MNNILYIGWLILFPSVLFSQEIKNYKSEFRQSLPLSSSAIDFITADNDLSLVVPEYCINFSVFPKNITNKKYKEYLENYVKKTCDLYLYPYDNYRVKYKETLDALRNSSEYLIKNYSKLSKVDQGIVENYLKSLD